MLINEDNSFVLAWSYPNEGCKLNQYGNYEVLFRHSRFCSPDSGDNEYSVEYFKNGIKCELPPSSYWKIDELNIEWNSLEEDYVPTLFERLKKFFYGVDYPKKKYPRPMEDSVVLCQYAGFYGICIYKYGNWISQMNNFHVRPEMWAYIPERVVGLVNAFMRVLPPHRING